MDNITSSITTRTFTNQGETHSYETKTFSLPMTLNGETRLVEFSGSNWCFTSESVFACQIGGGAKRHRGDCHAFTFDSVEDAKRAGYRSQDLFLVDNTITAIQGRANVRNRAARIVGWADQVAGTAQATEQKYYGSL